MSLINQNMKVVWLQDPRALLDQASNDVRLFPTVQHVELRTETDISNTAKLTIISAFTGFVIRIM